MSASVAFRTRVIFVLAFAVTVGGCLGTSNGLVLCTDADGHVAIEAPHLRHAHSHAEGADHEPHDPAEDADHGELHGLLATCSDSAVATQKLERSSADVTAAQQALAPLVLCLFGCPATGVQPASATHGLGAPNFRGGTAHPDVALRSVILLV
jgi:hypothetical protein